MNFESVRRSHEAEPRDMYWIGKNLSAMLLVNRCGSFLQVVSQHHFVSAGLMDNQSGGTVHFRDLESHP